MDHLAYSIKHYCPWLFHFLAACAAAFVSVRYRTTLKNALKVATVQGTIGGQSAEMRSLGPSDVGALCEFLNDLPPEHLEYFHPHAFDEKSLRRIVAATSVLKYGLFVEGEMIAYALAKISPSGKAYVGSVVAPAWTKRGIGKFLSRYAYWQVNLAGLRPCTTISRRNVASLKSHQSVSDFHIVRELPNDYMLIEYTTKIESTPTLNIA